MQRGRKTLLDFKTAPALAACSRRDTTGPISALRARHLPQMAAQAPPLRGNDLTALHFFPSCGKTICRCRSYQSEQTRNPGPVSLPLIMLMVNACK